MRLTISSKELARKLGLHEVWLETKGQLGQPADFSFRDLEGIQWAGRNLRRAIFVEASLKRVHLQEADLGEANFLDAFLVGADLKRADLQGACFRRAHLQKIDLAGANLRGADFAGAWLHEADLRHVKGLSRSQLDLAVVDSDTLLPHEFVAETSADAALLREREKVQGLAIRAKICLDFEPQTVTVTRTETALRIDCSCHESMTLTRCDHKLAILGNQPHVLVDRDAHRALETIQDWVGSTDFPSLWARYCEADSAAQEAQRTKQSIEAQLVERLSKGFTRGH